MILNLEINQPKDPPYTGTTRFEPKSTLTGWWVIETLPTNTQIPDNLPKIILDSKYPPDVRNKYGMYATLLVGDFLVYFLKAPRGPTITIAPNPKDAFTTAMESQIAKHPLRVALEANQTYYSGRLLVASG